MSSFTLKIDVKKFFLDRQKVLDRIGKAQAKVFMQAGGKVRTIARRSIRRRKRPSKIGQPPSSHVASGEFGMKTILFALPPGSDRVVVGPVGGKGSSVPRVLEFGGRSRTYNLPGKTHAYVAARPYMRPALEKFESSYPDLWKDVVKP